MIRILSTRLIQTFSVKNKTQNFFDMNPIYPDFADKNFDIYNSERKKIRVIDEFIKAQSRERNLRKLVQHQVYARKYNKFKRYSGGRKIRLDPDTKLILGMDSDFDDFVKVFKRDQFMDKTAKTQFKETLLKLIRKFKCKSQPQLIRLFRISIANSRKKSLLDKLRGGIMQEAVLKTTQIMKNYQILKSGVDKKTNDSQQQEFERVLKQIDDKIQNAQEALRYDQRGLPKVLSNYDHKYGYNQTGSQELNLDFNLDLMQGNIKSIYRPQPTTIDNLQDQSIKGRINRLYFLRRLQYLKKGQTEFKSQQLNQELPLNIRQRQKIMNELAFKYKQDDLMQIPDLNQIYREIDTFVDKVYVKVSTSRTKPNEEDEIEDRNPEASQFLWQNINAEQILCETLYSDSSRSVTLTEQYLRDISPNAQTQHSLTKIPINLYRHSELNNIGIFNEYRQKLGDNLMRVQQIDFEPAFEDFSLQQAQRKYRKIQKSKPQLALSSSGHARRKKAYAEVRVKRGTGVVTINGKPIQDYFGDTYYRVETLKPLVFTDTSGLYDLKFNVFGSGQKGQSECMAYALARALIKMNPDHKRILAKFGLVGYDFRKKEAKKTNLYKARVRPPYVRR